MTPRVFFITGTSTGFGKEYVNIALSQGNYVVATARNCSALSFPDATDANCLRVNLDVTNKAAIDKAFDAAMNKFGHVDVVCNNAGYGLMGEFEAMSDEDIRQQMEVNFFGLVDVTRKAIQIMREQKTGGVIQQVSSFGGRIGVPTGSMYNASKFALEGFTEAVALEMKPEWNIKFTILEPGGFRTDWAGRSAQFPAKKHPAYDHVDGRARMAARHGTQPGDPKKGAQAFYDLAVMENPPIRCLVGTDAFALMKKKLAADEKLLVDFEKISNSTDIDGYVPPS
ncbi:hypothetical protein BDY21DRAFT_364788 [Lineolata rhizophorae]|uniref:NAD(P)-binding protein n=1 Tax=Lineolata rhizophorae TaxID=578093 RepID=A0A6A6NW70_9PEZI|nr:hypothetical protein BDY21DRAFT_364788 [Lineolata rhizophorae]